MAKAVKQKRSQLADDIVTSLLEVQDYIAGKQTGAVVHHVTIEQTDARQARMTLGLSQNEFAALIGTAVGTVRKWELGTRKPSGPARTLIDIIKKEPKAVRRALG
jgi:putative transcriptional regulator